MGFNALRAMRVKACLQEWQILRRCPLPQNKAGALLQEVLESLCFGSADRAIKC